MRVAAILRKLYGRCLAQIHAARFAAVLVAVEALLSARRLSLTSVGRAIAGPTAVKHSIKRVDRLLGNVRMQAELRAWYRAIAEQVVGKQPRPLVLLDWTELNGGLCALTAAVAAVGRAIPIYQEAHPIKKLGNAKVTARFLDGLRAVLPGGCRPVIVADAGFRCPFFLACRRRGLDFVVRLRGDDCLLGRTDRRDRFSVVQAAASTEAQCLGDCLPYATSPGTLLTRVVLGSRTKRAVRKSDGYYKKRALDPLLLATSIDDEPAQGIVAIYLRRMQIEETFRDAKNFRCGWSLRHCGCRSRKRIEMLLLVAAIGLYVQQLVGLAAENLGLHRRHQANTERKRRVLSIFVLGGIVLRSQGDPISATAIKRAVTQLRAATRTLGSATA